jgi:hypothetical protein
MTDHNSPETVRAEINDLLDKIPDRETLTFLLWMFRKIAANEELHRLSKSQPCGMHLFASCALCGTRRK